MRLTKRLLNAMNDALSAGLAGCEGEGDLADTSFADMDDAQTWVAEQLRKRATKSPRSPS